MKDRPINTPMNKILLDVGTIHGIPKHVIESQLRRALDSAQVKIMKRFKLAGKVTTKMFLNLMLFEMR